MSREFAVRRAGVRVVFGAGAVARVAAEVDALGLARIVVIGTPGRRAEVDAVAAALGPRAVAVAPIAREHVPAETVAEARAIAERAAADAALAVGGGSAIGLAKMLALGGAVRALCVPTTYSGSETTPIYGTTEAGTKRTGRDERVRPQLVIYDPVLTLGLPRATTVTSLWNALAHAVEALWADGTDRVATLAAEEAARMIATALPRLVARLDDRDARELAFEAAYLAGFAFADAGPGLHHKLCHLLGGSFDLPHAPTHAALLPHVVAYAAPHAPAALAALGRALGADDPVAGLFALARATGAPATIALPPASIERAVELALPTLPDRPHRPDRGALHALLSRAAGA